MQGRQPACQILAVRGPRHAVHARRRRAIQRMIGRVEQVHRHVVHQTGEPQMPVPSCCLTYPGQPTRRARPAPCPACGRLSRISLGHRPFLPRVRGPTDHAKSPAPGGGFPAALFRSRGGCTVPPSPNSWRIPALFPAFTGTTPMSDFPTACMSGVRPQAFPDRSDDGLRATPTDAAGISRFSCRERPRMHRVLDSAGPMTRLALTPPIVLPSLPGHEVGTPKRVISELNTWPALSPVNAYRRSLRTDRHDSGPWWVATAFHVRLLHPLLPAGLSRRSDCPLFSLFSVRSRLTRRVPRR